MKKLSTSLLANLVATKRKELKLTQQDLADATGINRAQISRLENSVKHSDSSRMKYSLTTAATSFHHHHR